MRLLRRILAGVVPGITRQSTSPAVAFTVTDEEGRVLVDVADARREDYRFSVPLLSGDVIVDMNGHYQRFIDGGGERPYRGTDAACNTYVKFGECIQDKRELHILIQPSTWREGI